MGNLNGGTGESRQDRTTSQALPIQAFEVQEVRMGKVRVCETVIRPRIVPTQSSKDENVYYATIPATIWNDPVCDCRGYEFRGTCRHTKVTEESRCHWFVPLDEISAAIETCPMCGMPAVSFDPKPEFE